MRENQGQDEEYDNSLDENQVNIERENKARQMQLDRDRDISSRLDKDKSRDLNFQIQINASRGSQHRHNPNLSKDKEQQGSGLTVQVGRKGISYAPNNFDNKKVSNNQKDKTKDLDTNNLNVDHLNIIPKGANKKAQSAMGFNFNKVRTVQVEFLKENIKNYKRTNSKQQEELNDLNAKTVGTDQCEADKSKINLRKISTKKSLYKYLAEDDDNEVVDKVLHKIND